MADWMGVRDGLTGQLLFLGLINQRQQPGE